MDALRQPGDQEELFEEAVRRSRRYLEAGADCVFRIRLADEELIGDFVGRVSRPVNILGAGLPLPRLTQLGVARVSFAGTLMNRVYARFEQGLSDLTADVTAID